MQTNERFANTAMHQTYLDSGWRTGATFCKPSNGRVAAARARGGLFARFITFFIKGY